MHSNNSSQKPINCFSGFDYFVGLALKGLTISKSAQVLTYMTDAIQEQNSEVVNRRSSRT